MRVGQEDYARRGAVPERVAWVIVGADLHFEQGLTVSQSQHRGLQYLVRWLSSHLMPSAVVGAGA